MRRRSVSLVAATVAAQARSDINHGTKEGLARICVCGEERVRENVCGGERYVYKMVVSGIGPGWAFPCLRPSPAAAAGSPSKRLYRCGKVRGG